MALGVVDGEAMEVVGIDAIEMVVQIEIIMEETVRALIKVQIRRVLCTKITVGGRFHYILFTLVLSTIGDKKR